MGRAACASVEGMRTGVLTRDRKTGDMQVGVCIKVIGEGTGAAVRSPLRHTDSQ